MKYEYLNIMNDHLESGAVHNRNQMSIEPLKFLILHGYLINLHNRDNLNADIEYNVLTYKGFKKIMRWRKVFLLWRFMKRIFRNEY